MTSLRVTEIYPSIQGESTHAGRPCVFVRLTGCPLRCRWCDTEYAFTGGERLSISTIVERATHYGLSVCEVTGGEPLAQKETPSLLSALADRFDTVLLETAGHTSVAGLDRRVTIIMDLKAPGSGESARNELDNIEHLHGGDELKFVIADRADYDWARTLLSQRPPAAAVAVLFSPVHGELAPQELAEWLVDDRLDVRLQLQQHKYIWDPKARGV